MSAEAIRARYVAMFGHVPPTVEERLTLGAACGRLPAVEAIEAMREQLLEHNPLDARTQRLVHFAMVLVLGEDDAARLHARSALAAGVSGEELWGVCETAAVVAGMPAFTRGVALVSQLLGASPPEAAP